MAPTITELEVRVFAYECRNVGHDELGFNIVYEPDSSVELEGLAIRVETDTGYTGEYVGRNARVSLAQFDVLGDALVGRNPFERERFRDDARRALAGTDLVGLGPLDVALWDLAGKRADAPIHELLGTYRERLPVYVSTPHGDENGGLDSPEAFADFAETCRTQGIEAFKMHGWGGSDDARDVDREVAAVLALGEAVGDGMDLMLDPACEYETFMDALTVGRACDEAGFDWYEDPYRDTGSSAHGHRKLSQRLDTPILLTEYVRGLAPRADLAVADATDLLRSDPDDDGGITGAMRVAHLAAGLGLDVEYHAPGPAKRHCLAATRNARYYELGLLHPGWDNPLEPPVYADDYGDSLADVDADGTVPVPDGPGLGVDYDWDRIDRLTTTRRSFT